MGPMTGADRSADSVSARHSAWSSGSPLVLIVALYILPLAGSGIATNPNEVVRIELTASIALWARLDLGEAAAVYGLSEDVSMRDGKIFSDKAPGLSIAAVPALWIVDPILPRASSSDLPAYWPLRHLLTLLLVALPAVGLAILIGRCGFPVEPDRRVASTVIVALVTPLWTYGTVFFGHVPAALLITLSWFLLLGVPGRAHALGARRAALGGAAAGLGVATEYPTVLLAVVIFGTLLARRTALPILLSAVAGALAGALPALVYHQLAFGAPWLTGYGLKAHGDFQAIHARGVLGVSWPTIEAMWGILFSARRGVFVYCPLLLLMPVGLWWMIRSRGWRDAGPILVATATYGLFAAGFVDWTAGWCAAARHLVPVVPLALVVALGAAVKLAERRWGTAAVVVLVAASATNAVLSVVLTPFFPPQFDAPLAQLVLPSLADGAAFPNLASSLLGVPRVAVAGLVAAVVLGSSLWALARLISLDGRLTAFFLATVAMLLLTYGWLGSAPSSDTELMRAQVLRRLGHDQVAGGIEASIMPPATPAAD